MLSLQFTLLLPAIIGGASAAAVDTLHYDRTANLVPRDTTNGSCISAPDTSCVSLVGLCVEGIASGRVPSTQFWSDGVCTAAATCAGMGSVLNAACCAGTCHQPLDIVSLDYDTVYTSMVGAECAFQPGGCPLTWQPFVDWFYNTIQNTSTNLWPDSGDVVLGWWANIATWTAFCEGTNCVDSAIPYTNFNDWFHFSSAVAVTTPGTPQYVPPLSNNLTDNDDIWDPNFEWPCPFDDPDDCWWDYGPPTTATSATEKRAAEVLPESQLKKRRPSATSSSFGSASSGPVPANITNIDYQQPANVPPPTYVLGQPLVLHMNGTQYTPPPPSKRGPLEETSGLTFARHKKPTVDIEAPVIERRAIVPDTCVGTIESLPMLPVLSYYCNLLPKICANIRSHPDWPVGGSTMTLTYDPFNAGVDARREGVCTRSVVAAMQAAGKCDFKQHDPAYWNVSCDEFPFNSVLEGGPGNAQVLAVPAREQQFQGVLQSSITNLYSTANDKQTIWKGQSNRRCHRYVLQLLNAPESGAPATAVGSLTPNSAFLNQNSQAVRFVTHSRAAIPPTPEFTVNTPYPVTARALKVPSNSRLFDCRPCTIGPPPPGPPLPPRDLEGNYGNLTMSAPEVWDVGSDDAENIVSVPNVLANQGSETQGDGSTATAPPMKTDSIYPKRQESCTPDTTVLATSTPEVVSVASDSAVAVATAIAAASSASAAATDAAPSVIASAAAAVAAANLLTPAASALTSATDDISYAAAVAAANAAIEVSQDAVSSIWSLFDIPDLINDVADSVTSASAAVADVVSNVQNVIPPSTPIAPPLDPAKDPIISSGPPPGAPAAKCFGPGSTGSIILNGEAVLLGGGSTPVSSGTLKDVGSDAFFGLFYGEDIKVSALEGCQGVYSWVTDDGEAPNYQVNCDTMEFGTFWEGVQQACYAYSTEPPVFDTICGNNLANIYQCLQGRGMYREVDRLVHTWAPS